MNIPDIQTLAIEAARLYYTGKQKQALIMYDLTCQRLNETEQEIFFSTYEDEARSLQDVGDTYDLRDNQDNMTPEEIYLAEKIIETREAVA